MGILTLTELQNEVRAALGGRTDLNSRLTSIINLAQTRLARMKDFREMQVISTTPLSNTGSDNDKYIVLPNVRKVFSVVILDGANSRKLTQRTPQFWDRFIPKPEHWARDRPTDYIIWNNTLEIYPLPASALTLKTRWTRYPNALVAGTDVSEFLQKDDVLIELSIAYAMRSLGKEDDARKHESHAQTLLNEGAMMDESQPDMNILPAASDSQVMGGTTHEYWNDPFYRGS